MSPRSRPDELRAPHRADNVVRLASRGEARGAPPPSTTGVDARTPRMPVLVVVDGASASARAVEYVGRVLGARPQFAVRLLGVQRPPPATLVDVDGAEPHTAVSRRRRDRLRAWRRHARTRVARALDDAREALCAAGIPAGGVAVDVSSADGAGDFADVVLRVARRYRCRTIVVAGEEAAWLRRLLRENLAETLVRRSRGTAVWVIR